MFEAYGKVLFTAAAFIGLVVSTVVEEGWTTALVGLAVALVITGIQYAVGRCLRPKQVRLLLTGSVIMLPGGRKS